MATLLYQGHGSLRLTTDSGKVVYIDPFMGGDDLYRVPADLILVTHQHYDHNQIDKMPHAEGCVVWQNMDSHPSPATYLTRTFLDGELTAEAVEAYNHHHKKDECVGYVVQVDGVSVYFSGDTGETDQMRRDLCARGIDWVFLPGDGTYTMTEAEAAKLAQSFGSQCHVVPIHLAPGKAYDAAKARRFAAMTDNAVLIEPGQTVELVK